MQITSSHLRQIMPNAVKNVGRNSHFQGYTFEQILLYILRYAQEFDINTPLRWCHYLAQIAHESGELRYSEEIASGKAYDTGKLAIKLGNTPEADGDGQKYKGRGLIQVTGRANYEAYKRYCGFDVVKQPELLCKPVGAVRSSMWFWHRKGLNELADRDEFTTITKRINGGTNGIEERRKYPFPHCKLFWKTSTQQSAEMHANFYKIEEPLLQLLGYLSVPVIDSYAEVGIMRELEHYDNDKRSQNQWTSDGTHPTSAGYQMDGDFVASKLKSWFSALFY